MKIIYIAGKFSAKSRMGVEDNILAAIKGGVVAAKCGHMPLIPHANNGKPIFGSLQPYKFWIEGTMLLLQRAADELWTVGDWEVSSGARGEVAWALGETGPWRWFWRLKRLITGVGRIPVRSVDCYGLLVDHSWFYYARKLGAADRSPPLKSDGAARG